MMKRKGKYAIYGLLALVLAAALFGLAHGAAAFSAAPGAADTCSAGLTAGARLCPTLSDTARQAAAQMLRDELDYYLDRHNVSDEGYEMVVAFADGRRHQHAADSIPIWNVGRWKGHQRQGTAVSRDALGRITIGHWEADTLESGIRIDSTGYYQGALRNTPKGPSAEGHGAYTAANGTYYEGHWHGDCRDGFGLQLLENEFLAVLKAGQWQDDRYLGERMNYTSERIYGIDISRYQHGKGRKKYPIRWQQLRITHLGSKSKKQISGTVDYPVSFCFIKSTEGISVRNPYYAQDYQAARRAGIPVGAYHFFSTRRTGQAQAQYFIRNTRFQRGDLPPVLDIEPSDGDIARSGGSRALWRNIRDWLQAVERRCGVKPILYVNQKFVNKYLPEAPDVKHDYKVWIARYGEYKPDVRLAVWQLSPDGRVRGITGEVDINVFNGYQQQFDDFISQETIK